ncbi:MAG TPA: type II toxin-antitoxin system HicB family antitoxin [Armatimonadota bacterium]|jgi:predicted RNase H-like HicB family nuclease
MTQHFTASIWQEDDWYIAQCLEVDVASQGKTRDEAVANLREALHLHFTPPIATVAPDITSIEVDVHAT